MIQESIQQYESSSRKRRIAAFLIDHTLFTVILVSIVFFTNDELLNGESDLSSSLIIGWVAIIFYLAKDCFNGISPGKWIMNITEYSKPDNHSFVQ